ncbi:Cof-type HAD-IIB family hydrolase [Metabacillus iocasae]|uniref:Cof subfamily protein (Haloacid dehalogenase superfamily) n=1 Tax=Priestia iocasae TaxID=2291674 RepID=A0ABS2QTI6_9BACI|nr:Cof-type HAD-IIB family hydrolase [Metabacillus iocasae]MBM7702789.1 Cof subfamily protein (haloacid dehalogenase superfamily) [Metabacillus iocasae]
MTTKLIAIDLDGTLLNNQNEISAENLQAMKEAQAQGVEVVVATGRAAFDVKKIFEQTDINTWIIAANGATIHQPNGEPYLSVPMKKSDALDSLKWLEENGYYYEVFSEEAIYTPQNGRELIAIEMDRLKSANPELDLAPLRLAASKQFSQSGFAFIPSYKELEDEALSIYNILAFSFDDEKLTRGWNRFKDREDLTLVTSAHHNFELEHKDASKGNALKRLASQLRIPLDETAAIGDSMNDYSMISIAKTGIAMGNARQEIKDIATFITKENDEHGVAHAIYRLLEEK